VLLCRDAAVGAPLFSLAGLEGSCLRSGPTYHCNNDERDWERLDMLATTSRALRGLTVAARGGEIRARWEGASEDVVRS
jgi:hypothetical protein